MPGKRPRQIRRTTSMSQLGGCGGAGAFTPVRTAATAPESFEAADCTPSPVAKNAVNPPGLRPPCGPQDPPLHEDMEVCSPGPSFSTSVETATAAVQNGGNPQSMAIDVGVEESLDASHADKTSSLQAYKLAYQPPHLGYSPQSLCNRSMVGTQSSFSRGGSVGSVQQAHFLDVCYHCMKRLGHGRDIFIYRGDRAFCSVECRHHQIAADERREKWGLAAVKKGVGATTPAGSTGQQMGTAAAA